MAVLLSDKSSGGPEASPKFVYDPIDVTQPGSIRLLKIIGCENGKPCCSLIHTSVSKAKYYALSYAWGPAGNESVIVVNGKLMKVRRNLYDFLHRVATNKFPFIDLLRWKDPTCRNFPTDLLWIDAICLDQSNAKERNHQVQQMHTIYEDAQAVLAWLGRGKPHIEDWLNNPHRNNPETQRLAKEVLHLDYWSRLWVTQELALASNVFVLYGTCFLPWDSLWRRLYCYQGFHYSPAFVHHKVHQRRSKHGIYFASLLEDSGDLNCADPRDRVYGLLALAQRGQYFQVDYNDSLLQLATRLLTSVFCEDILFLGTVLRALSLEDHVLTHFARSLDVRMLSNVSCTPRKMMRARSLPRSHLPTYSREISSSGTPEHVSTYHFHCPTCGYKFPLKSLPLVGCLVVCGDLLTSSGHGLYINLNGSSTSWIGPLSSQAQYLQAENWLRRKLGITTNENDAPSLNGCKDLRWVTLKPSTKRVRRSRRHVGEPLNIRLSSIGRDGDFEDTTLLRRPKIRYRYGFSPLHPLNIHGVVEVPTGLRYGFEDYTPIQNLETQSPEGRSEKDFVLAEQIEWERNFPLVDSDRASY